MTVPALPTAINLEFRPSAAQKAAEAARRIEPTGAAATAPQHKQAPAIEIAIAPTAGQAAEAPAASEMDITEDLENYEANTVYELQEVTRLEESVLDEISDPESALFEDVDSDQSESELTSDALEPLAPVSVQTSTEVVHTGHAAPEAAPAATTSQEAHLEPAPARKSGSANPETTQSSSQTIQRPTPSHITVAPDGIHVTAEEESAAPTRRRSEKKDSVLREHVQESTAPTRNEPASSSAAEIASTGDLPEDPRAVRQPPTAHTPGPETRMHNMSVGRDVHPGEVISLKTSRRPPLARQMAAPSDQSEAARDVSHNTVAPASGIRTWMQGFTAPERVPGSTTSDYRISDIDNSTADDTGSFAITIDIGGARPVPHRAHTSRSRAA
jgi:hypothetical protein